MSAAVGQNDFRVAVRIARVVDEPRLVTVHSRVDDVITVHAEHVAADAARLVSPFSDVAHNGADQFARVFDDHFTRIDVAPTEESAAVNWRRIDADCLAREPWQGTEAHRHREIEAGRSPGDKENKIVPVLGLHGLKCKLHIANRNSKLRP